MQKVNKLYFIFRFLEANDDESEILFPLDEAIFSTKTESRGQEKDSYKFKFSEIDS